MTEKKKLHCPIKESAQVFTLQDQSQERLVGSPFQTEIKQFRKPLTVRQKIFFKGKKTNCFNTMHFTDAYFCSLFTKCLTFNSKYYKINRNKLLQNSPNKFFCFQYASLIRNIMKNYLFLACYYMLKWFFKII